MATPMPHTGPVGPDTLITVKIFINGQNRRFKLALRDLGAHVLPQKLRFLLQIPATTEVKFDRFSDSAGTFVTLDSANPAVYKQLYRAAKAKLKLRLKATIIAPEKPVEPVEQKDDAQTVDSKFADYRGSNFFDTVLAKPTGELRSAIEPKPAQTESIRQMTEKMAQLPLSRPTLPTLNDFCGTTFSIDCNRCGKSVSNEHYHCSMCELGDFDLCPSCIERGVTCDGEDHWLIKRTIKGGKVYSSNTETLPPKPKTQPAPAPAAVPAPVPAPAPVPVPAPATAPQPIVEVDQRSCNSCIIQLAASSFVTCQQCPDYDLCFFCLEQGQHGHHPAHTFTPVDATAPTVSPYIKTLCQQGRGLRHEAVCDGCEAQIVGVRHKCLTCPDFDYCSTCIHVAPEVHPSHRFAPIYEQLAAVSGRKEQHRGIYCDGPLCAARAGKAYIRGDRYKCAICHDTDFCANCEALPSNPHNRTHPLIKLKTPVRQLSIATVQQPNNGEAPNLLGDHPAAKHAATETTRSTSANAATQVQTVAETAPVENKPTVLEKAPAHPVAPLDAHFESESTPDGTTFLPDHLISQSWTLRNVGPTTWPAGCAVHFIGGDDMRNLDDKHPSPVSSMILANRSNTCIEPVEPGKSHTFTVTLKSPPREGRAISYWRLKTVDGLPFGHKLWCDINVSSKALKPVEAPAVVPVEAPAEQQESAAVETDKDEASSQMIFPTLEKESPESSISDVKQEPIAAEPNVVASEEQDLVDDLDSMALDDESTEDGFMTDEEYDILDAEDEEYLVNAQRVGRH